MSGEARADSPRARIAVAVLTLLKELYGRGPEEVKVYLAGGCRPARSLGGFTQAEATLLELGHGQVVRVQRAVVQEAVRQRFNGVIEAETGRKVKSFMSVSDHGADASSIVFLFAPLSPKEKEAEAGG
jgi:uncharacterized protein YbcI